MMTRNVLLNMELEEDDDEDGDIGECRSRDPGVGGGIRGGRLCAEAEAPKQLQVFFLRLLRAVFGGPCSRVHDTPESDSPRPQAVSQHQSAETQTKGLEARGRDAGRRRAEDGGTFPSGLLDVKMFPLTTSRHFTK